MQLNPGYWPDNVAFVRMMRSLVRQANYVAPYQEPVAPALQASRSDETDERAAAGHVGDDLRIGQWALTTNARGDVVWRHDSGHEEVTARLPDVNDAEPPGQA